MNFYTISTTKKNNVIRTLIFRSTTSEFFIELKYQHAEAIIQSDEKLNIDDLELNVPSINLYDYQIRDLTLKKYQETYYNFDNNIQEEIKQSLIHQFTASSNIDIFKIAAYFYNFKFVKEKLYLFDKLKICSRKIRTF